MGKIGRRGFSLWPQGRKASPTAPCGPRGARPSPSSPRSGTSPWPASPRPVPRPRGRGWWPGPGPSAANLLGLSTNPPQIISQSYRSLHYFLCFLFPPQVQSFSSFKSPSRADRPNLERFDLFIPTSALRLTISLALCPAPTENPRPIPLPHSDPDLERRYGIKASALSRPFSTGISRVRSHSIPKSEDTMMSGEAWLFLLAVLINAVNLFLQVFFTIMYSDLEWYDPAAYATRALTCGFRRGIHAPSRLTECTLADARSMAVTTSILSSCATASTPTLSPRLPYTVSSPFSSLSTATGWLWLSICPCLPGTPRSELPPGRAGLSPGPTWF